MQTSNKEGERRKEKRGKKGIETSNKAEEGGRREGKKGYANLQQRGRRRKEEGRKRKKRTCKPPTKREKEKRGRECQEVSDCLSNPLGCLSCVSLATVCTQRHIDVAIGSDGEAIACRLCGGRCGYMHTGRQVCVCVCVSVWTLRRMCFG